MSFERKNLAMPAIIAVATTIILNAVLGQDGQHPAPMGNSATHKQISRIQPPAVDTGRLEEKILKRRKTTPVKPKAAQDAIGKLLKSGNHVKKTGAAATVLRADAQKIRFVQTRLTQLGYEIGTIDGVMGEKTREAIKKYESARKIPVTGEVSRTLLKALSRSASFADMKWSGHSRFG